MEEDILNFSSTYVVTDNLIILCVQLGFNQKFLVSWKKCFLNNKIKFNNKA
jgi:hypothetical protein